MNPIGRRSFLVSSLSAAIVAPSVAASLASPRATLRPRGMFIRDCGIAGETRADDVFPAHPNGTQLSRDRFLIIYATRAWRGIDDDRSIVYQVRADGYAGRVLKEGIFARARDDWDAFGDGRKFKLSHGAPTVFGVPRGARVKGRTPAHANLFVAKWYKYAREFTANGEVRSGRETEELSRRTRHVEWVQFRLNPAGDDIEIVQEPSPLVPAGRPLAPRGLPPEGNIVANQGYAAVVPFNEEATEWVDMHTVVEGNRMPLVVFKYRFAAGPGRYEWVETSRALFGERYDTGDPARGGGDWTPFEASIVRLAQGDWAICARSLQRPALWYRTDDPFSARPGKIFAEKTPDRPTVIAPVTVFRCADGRIRLFSGDKEASPYQKPRDPLYCWDVDPDRGFAQSNRRVVFDGRATLPQVRPEAYVMADMCKVLPHAGGSTQMLVHRVRTWSINHAIPDKGPALLPQEKTVQGIYAAEIDFGEALPGAWDF